ncbi:Uu.00g145740.m01.CDS01 [Anthostomella pinea]|uniref:Uu.00g145740.m01.CDS01 n=1 Tax=Anthostomella pinea TaxID=933095 RepID=A0AAI8VR53_9PEZI|nr:Uu.00g145740.m01.CDS01 [Anthostomella pinea]
MKSTILSLAAILAAATALPTPLANAPTALWAVNEFSIYSSQSTRLASISFLTDAPATAGPTYQFHQCRGTMPADADGGVPAFVRIPCDDAGSTTFSFNPPTDDSKSAASLLIYAAGKTGVAMFNRKSLVFQDGTERWVGSANFAISNIF